MALLALGAAAPSLGLVFGIGGSVAGGIGGIALGLLASYIDQQLIFPFLFGKDDRPPTFGNLPLGSNGPGAPRWDVIGARAWVPVQYLWVRNLTQSVSGGGTGKGARPVVQHQRADVGLGIANGPVQVIDVMYADGRPFFAQQFNRFLQEDFRWSIEAGAGGSAGRLVITGTDTDVVDFTVLFKVGWPVRLENVLPANLSGYWRVALVVARTGTANTRIELTPLQGQTPATGTAGSQAEPARLRIIDSGAVGHSWAAISGNPFGLVRASNDPNLPGPPNYTTQDVKNAWVVGGTYRWEGFSPATANGLFRLRGWARPLNPTGSVYDNYVLTFEALEGQPNVGPITAGTATNAASVIREESLNSGNGGFLFNGAVEGLNFYPGTLTQTQDPFLAAAETDPPSFLGLSYISLKQWDIAIYGRYPELTAQVRSSEPPTLAVGLNRLMGRTVPPGLWDVSLLRNRSIVGYAVQGGVTTTQALQPLLTFYGINVQERGGVLTFLDERDLPLVQVPTFNMNSRPPSEAGDGVHGFLPEILPDEDKPQRVLVHFANPTNEGADGVEGAGFASPSDPIRGTRDTLDINLKPLAVFPADAKKRANELRRKLMVEMVRGKVRLGPGYLDVLPGHRLQMQGVNWNIERMAAATTINHTAEIRDLIPGSVQIEVRIVGAGRARLVDDGAGNFLGFPAGITTSTNTVNYGTGVIQITLGGGAVFDVDAPPVTRYRWDQQLVMRVQKALVSGADMSLTCDLTTSPVEEPLPPLPARNENGSGVPIVGGVPQYDAAVIDLPPIYSALRRGVFVGFAATPTGSEFWRGATVYSSANGLGGWQVVGTMEQPTSIARTAAGPALPPADHAFVDWQTVLTVDMPGTQQLADASAEEIARGANLALWGRELIQFYKATNVSGNRWELRGLLRGLHGTDDAMTSHPNDGLPPNGAPTFSEAWVVLGMTETDGTTDLSYPGNEQFIVLWPGFGFLHGLLHEVPGGYSAAGSTQYFAIIPGGATIEQYATTGVPFGQVLVAGRSARPAKPVFTSKTSGDFPQGGFGQKSAGAEVQINWSRRATDQLTLFGAQTFPAGDFQQYVVTIYDASAADLLMQTPTFLTLEQAIEATRRRRIIVGGPGHGALSMDQWTFYNTTEMGQDGFTLGVSRIGAVVRQRGAAGDGPNSDPIVSVFS